ncbi:TetR/AcrR family transcriptional regulator [bacterium]|nr:TetR/AcrR family transcriptional regulator [bacterium]
MKIIKQAELALKRKIVLDAAESLFEKNGIEETSMEALAKAVGYTRASLYNHFVSWDDICFQVFFKHSKIRWLRRLEAMSLVSTAIEKVYIWGRSGYEYGCENPLVVELQTYLDYRGLHAKRITSEIMGEYDELNMHYKDLVHNILEEGISEGSIREDIDIDYTISHLAYALRAIINRALAQSYSMVTIKPDDYIEQFLELFIRGLKS